jgi:hypothetical protein
LLSWASLALTAALTLFISAYVLQHPLATNDGPVHVAFSHLMMTWHQPGQPMQSRAYELALKPTPNLMAYLLMAWMMRFLSPDRVESIVQLLCIAGPVIAGWIALRAIERRNSWLAIFVLPFTLSQMFFYGLYNHCIAIGAFFLTMGAYFWLVRKPSGWRAAVLGGSLVLTFFFHASGFIMASAALWTLIGVAAFGGYRHDRRFLPLLYRMRFVLMAMLVEFPLAAILLSMGEKGKVLYDVSFKDRIKYFFELHLLAVNYPTYDRWPARLLSLVLLSAMVFFSWRMLSDRRKMTWERRYQMLGTLACVCVSFAIMMAFPDTMGGGWTHFRRFEIFPFLFMLLALPFADFSARAMGGLMAIAFATSAFLMGSTVNRQAMIREQMAPLFEADRHIADHCTVLPLVLDNRPIVYVSRAWMDYQPFFESASKLELHGDRVVLFNYLARLKPYPVHFQPGVEPQDEIFHWQPAQIATHFTWIDMDRFEKDSNLAIDYVLVWGRVPLQPLEMQKEIWYTTARFKQVYRSENGMATLYERVDKRNQFCAIGPETATPAGK